MFGFLAVVLDFGGSIEVWKSGCVDGTVWVAGTAVERVVLLVFGGFGLFSGPGSLSRRVCGVCRMAVGALGLGWMDLWHCFYGGLSSSGGSVCG